MCDFMGAILKYVLPKAQLTQRLLSGSDLSSGLAFVPVCVLPENLSSDDVTSSFKSLIAVLNCESLIHT